LKIIPADLEAVHGIPLFNPISHAFNPYSAIAAVSMLNSNRCTIHPLYWL